LLSNALKYGAGKPIDISVRASDGSARLEVRDRGAGIDGELAAMIFERFGRAGSVTHFGGLGLGLYLCRETIEAHDGVIRFESKPGAGCAFIVTLPLHGPDIAGGGRK
jgi:signal transduction histidine kinase